MYLLPGAELNQMLNLVVAIKSETPCEPELLPFAGMNDHLHAARLLEHLKGEASAPKKIWEATQTLFAAMKELQESVVSRFGPKTRVALTTYPGAACLAVCVCKVIIDSGRERRADTYGSSQSRAGADNFETSYVRVGSGMCRCVSCFKRIPRFWRIF